MRGEGQSTEHRPSGLGGGAFGGLLRKKPRAPNLGFFLDDLHMRGEIGFPELSPPGRPPRDVGAWERILFGCVALVLGSLVVFGMQAHLVDPTSDFFRFGAAVAIALCAAAAWRSVIWGTDFATRHARHFRGPFGHLRFAWRRGAHVWASFISAILILRILFPGQPLIEEMAHPMLLTMFGAIAFAFVGSFHYPARDVGGI